MERLLGTSNLRLAFLDLMYVWASSNQQRTVPFTSSSPRDTYYGTYQPSARALFLDHGAWLQESSPGGDHLQSRFDFAPRTSSYIEYVGMTIDKVSTESAELTTTTSQQLASCMTILRPCMMQHLHLLLILPGIFHKLTRSSRETRRTVPTPGQYSTP